MYGYKLVTAEKQSAMKRSREWYRNRTMQYKHLHHYVTGSRFVKKSRRKIENLHNVLHILMNENTCRQILLSFWCLFISFFFCSFSSHFQIIKCIMKSLISTSVEYHLKIKNLRVFFGTRAQVHKVVYQSPKQHGYAII